MSRFSKATMLGYLLERARRLEQSQGFVPSNGWNQVDGKGEATNRLYGEYAFILRTINEIQDGYIR